MKYFDAHCHIQFEQYDADRDAVVNAMLQKEVGGIVVGCDLESSKKAIALAEQHEHLWASVGVHPNHESDEWYKASHYRELAKHPKVVAIGECGLDYFRPLEVTEELKEKQKMMFRDHIKLAAEVKKPLIVHARPSKGTMDAYDDALDTIEEAKKEHPNLEGDLHFFVGNSDVAQRAFSLGFTISYTAVLTFTHDYDEVIRSAPLTGILSETDSPYVAPANRRGQRNDPLSVIDVVQAIARIRGEDEEAVRKTLLENAQKRFNLWAI